MSLRALPSGHDYGVTQTHAPLSRFSDSKMFNLSDSLGRPLFANIQVRATATRLASVRSSYAPHPAPKDLARLRGVPED